MRTALRKLQILQSDSLRPITMDMMNFLLGMIVGVGVLAAVDYYVLTTSGLLTQGV